MPSKVAGTLTGAAGGAAAGSVAGPIGTGVGALVGGLVGYLGSGDGGNNTAKPLDPSNFKYGEGNGMFTANQLAAQQVQSGLQQQQGQNNRESAYNGQANNNFQIANDAQGRGGLSVGIDPNDVQNQLAALGGTFGNASALNAMGTAPMGASYAAAQLKQGQDSAMAQQLSMARSGRSLGSGQAAMQQAAFNNSAINQATNQQAVSARIQEQNQYNQFQLGALGASTNAFGQAGGQATTIRTGNEGVQKTNADLLQGQERINNDTTSIYNNLGSHQQDLGMQANNLGQAAQQFGVQQGAEIQRAQLAANTALGTGGTPIALANQDNANAHDAADASALSAGIGVIPSVVAGVKGMSGTPEQSQGAAQDQGQTISPANHPTPGMNGKPVISDERDKKNVKPIDYYSQPQTGGYGTDPSQIAGRWYDQQHPGEARKTIDAMNALNAPPVIHQPTYAQTIAALNNGYSESYNNPANVLREAPRGPINMMPQMHTQAQLDAHAAAVAPRMAPTSLGATAPPGGYSTGRGAAPISAFTGSAMRPGNPYTPPPAAPVSANRSFGAPELDPTIQDYLNGADPYPQNPYPTAPSAPAQPVAGFSGVGLKAPDASSSLSSDVHSKTRIRELEGQLAALQGPPSASFAPQQPDTAALDDAYRGQGGQPQAPGVDLRAARGYEYEYKDPNQTGAAPGRHVGPMAQDLEHTAAAGTVMNGPGGKTVDTPRLTMVNTAAVGEVQRRQDELEQQLAALGAPKWAPYSSSPYQVAR